MCCGRMSFVQSMFCGWRNKDRLHLNTITQFACQLEEQCLIKLAGYLCLAMLKQRWTFSLRSVIICNLNKDIALPFWKGQVQHFLRWWANLQSKKGQRRKNSEGMWDAQPGMSAWLHDQVKIGEKGTNTVTWWWAVLALQVSRSGRWITYIIQNRGMEFFSRFKPHNAPISVG